MTTRIILGMTSVFGPTVVHQTDATVEWSNNPRERLNREIRRRTDVVGIFPDSNALVRLIGAVLAEQHDDWIEGRRHLGLDVLARSRTRLLIDDDPNQPALSAPAEAISA